MIDIEKKVATIQKMIPAPLQKRYTELCRKVSAETITPAEHKILLKLIDKIEMKNAERLKKLIVLAERLNMPFDEFMNKYVPFKFDDDDEDEEDNNLTPPQSRRA